MHEVHAGLQPANPSAGVVPDDAGEGGWLMCGGKHLELLVPGSTGALQLPCLRSA